jgi:lipopolysaccharide export system permease protein
VEIHKKYAIAFACLIFILLGAPFAMRFPQGGVGMVIATSVGIFFLYWMGLIGGERLAERGHLEPWVAMWFPT